MELNQKQRKRIADILTNAGNITLAASVIGPLFQKGDLTPVLIVVGVVTSILLYVGAILLERED